MRIDLKQNKLYDPILVGMTEQLEGHFGVEFTMSSGHRPGDPGVHGTNPCRGIDLICRDRQMGKAVESYLNQLYIYDPSRVSKNVCLYHDAGSGYHLHLQVHQDTELR